MSLNDLLTLAEVTKMLGFTSQWTRELALRGELGPTKEFKGLLLISPHYVKKFINRRTNNGTLGDSPRIGRSPSKRTKTGKARRKRRKKPLLPERIRDAYQRVEHLKGSTTGKQSVSDTDSG